jgi:hypothetical protein
VELPPLAPEPEPPKPPVEETEGREGGEGGEAGAAGEALEAWNSLEGLDDLLLKFVFFFHVYYPVVRKRFGIHIPYELWGASYYVLNLLYPGTK